MKELTMEIDEKVKKLNKQYLLDLHPFTDIPVAKSGIIDDNNTFLLIVTDTNFAQERLYSAKKHIRDYNRLPNKGQFPFTEYNEKENKIVFNGSYFAPNFKKMIKSGELKQV